jgi:hypothetical protein
LARRGRCTGRRNSESNSMLGSPTEKGPAWGSRHGHRPERADQARATMPSQPNPAAAQGLTVCLFLCSVRNGHHDRRGIIDRLSPGCQLFSQQTNFFPNAGTHRRGTFFLATASGSPAGAPTTGEPPLVTERRGTLGAHAIGVVKFGPSSYHRFALALLYEKSS